MLDVTETLYEMLSRTNFNRGTNDDYKQLQPKNTFLYVQETLKYGRKPQPRSSHCCSACLDVWLCFIALFKCKF